MVDRAVWSTQSTLQVFLLDGRGNAFDHICPLVVRYDALASSRIQLTPPPGSELPTRFRQCRSYGAGRYAPCRSGGSRSHKIYQCTPRISEAKAICSPLGSVSPLSAFLSPFAAAESGNSSNAVFITTSYAFGATELLSAAKMRSEERREGKECVRTFRSRWSPYH